MSRSAQETPAQSIEKAAVPDLRLPVAMLMTSAAVWLVLASLLQVLASWKLVIPAVADGLLSFGLLKPAAFHAFVYGWVILSGLSTALWILSRFSIPKPGSRFLPLMAAGLWNFGTAVGVIGILAGNCQATEWLAFPGSADIILTAALALMAWWVFTTFVPAGPNGSHISLWYISAAILCILWAFPMASACLIWHPVAAPAQLAIHWWFAQIMTFGWIVPLAMAGIYFVISSSTGRPIFSASLAKLGVWSLLVAGGFSGGRNLVGAPAAPWLPVISTAAAIISLIPAIAVATNFHLSLQGKFESVRWDPVLRFAVVGAVIYSGFSILFVLTSFDFASALLGFTDFGNALMRLLFFGTFSMVEFACFYAALPWLAGGQWASAPMIRWHFRLAVAGLAICVASGVLGGFLQGLAFSDPEAIFKTSFEFASPFRWISAAGESLLATSNVIFAVHFFRSLCRPNRTQSGPTLLALPDETEAAT